MLILFLYVKHFRAQSLDQETKEPQAAMQNAKLYFGILKVSQRVPANGFSWAAYLETEGLPP